MSNFFPILFVGIALSMDAFSLSLTFGTLNITKKNIFFFSITTALFHFFLPLLGLALGTKALSTLPINPNDLLGIILLILGIKIIYDMLSKEEPTFSLNIFGYLLFAILVSFDSFTTGIGLPAITTNFLLSSTTFSLTSGFFTSLGCIISKKVSSKLGKKANYLGLTILIILGLYYLCK